MLVKPRFCQSLALSLAISFSCYAAESPRLSANDGLSGLPHALQATLTYNPAVKSQQSELAARGDAVDVAKSGRYPSMRGSFGSDDDAVSYIELEQPLWTFGKVSSAIATEQAGFSLQQQRLLQVQRELMEKTAAAYTQVQSARLKLTVAKENYKEHKSLYERIQRRQAGQLASKADVNLAESRLLGARSDMLSYQSDLQAQLNELYALTRVQVASHQPVAEGLLQLPASAALKEQILSHSALVSLAVKRVNLAKAQLKQTEAAPLPTLSMQVQQYMLDSNDNETRVGLVLDGALDGMGFTSYSQTRGAQKAIVAAEYELDNMRNEIDRQSENLLVNLRLQVGLRNTKLESVDALEKTMRSFLRQYETNRKTWVEVLNQQRELTSMRYSLISTDQQYSTLALKLAIMAGKLDALAGVTP